jgi:hypothetical protein
MRFAVVSFVLFYIENLEGMLELDIVRRRL